MEQGKKMGVRGGWGVEIGLGRGITGDDKGHEDTVCEIDGCGPKI